VVLREESIRSEENFNEEPIPDTTSAAEEGLVTLRSDIDGEEPSTSGDIRRSTPRIGPYLASTLAEGEEPILQSEKAENTHRDGNLQTWLLEKQGPLPLALKLGSLEPRDPHPRPRKSNLNENQGSSS
jgi:hypothetical protein